MDRLLKDGVLGVVRSANGTMREFRRRGVIDLFELLTTAPDFLRGGSIADKVIGRGAALLLVKGRIRSVYAQTISTGALDILQRAGIAVRFDTEVAYIKNRAGNGQCPVEQLTASTDNPQEAYNRIKLFLNQQRNQQI